MREPEHCYGAPHHCNGPGSCSCDCPACEAITPYYRPFWCLKHPGKRHIHHGTLTGDVWSWACVDG